MAVVVAGTANLIKFDLLWWVASFRLLAILAPFVYHCISRLWVFVISWRSFVIPSGRSSVATKKPNKFYLNFIFNWTYRRPSIFLHMNLKPLRTLSSSFWVGCVVVDSSGHRAAITCQCLVTWVDFALISIMSRGRLPLLFPPPPSPNPQRPWWATAIPMVKASILLV